MTALLERLGTRAVRLLDLIGGMLHITLAVGRAWLGLHVNRHELLRHLAYMANGSLLIVIVTAFFAGGLMTLQLGAFVTKFGASGLAGWAAGYAVLREIGPILIGLMFSGRVGAKTTAELATMTVTEQLEGLRAMAISPVRYLLAPRVLAMMIALVALTLVGDAVALAGASLVARHMLDISWSAMFFGFVDNLAPGDLIHGLIKAAGFGAVTGVTSSYFGTSVTGGTTGVGQAVNASVVTTAVAIVLFDFFISFLLG